MPEASQFSKAAGKTQSKKETRLERRERAENSKRIVPCRGIEPRSFAFVFFMRGEHLSQWTNKDWMTGIDVQYPSSQIFWFHVATSGNDSHRRRSSHSSTAHPSRQPRRSYSRWGTDHPSNEEERERVGGQQAHFGGLKAQRCSRLSFPSSQLYERRHRRG